LTVWFMAAERLLLDALATDAHFRIAGFNPLLAE
jgi:hypothetical protein